MEYALVTSLCKDVLKHCHCPATTEVVAVVNLGSYRILRLQNKVWEQLQTGLVTPITSITSITSITLHHLFVPLSISPPLGPPLPSLSIFPTLFPHQSITCPHRHVII